MAGSRALGTGASSGIGEATARLFAAQGARGSPQSSAAMRSRFPAT